jgi:hypothetical protein
VSCTLAERTLPTGTRAQDAAGTVHSDGVDGRSVEEPDREGRNAESREDEAVVRDQRDDDQKPNGAPPAAP